MYNMRVSSFIWCKMRMIAQVTGPQITEKLLQRGRGEGQYVWDFGEGGVQAIRFCRKFLLVAGAVLTMKDFRALLGMIYKN